MPATCPDGGTADFERFGMNSSHGDKPAKKKIRGNTQKKIDTSQQVYEL
jgi:hypothetical protein